MGKKFFAMIVFSFANPAFASDFQSRVTEEAAMIEEQSKLACGAENNNPIKNSIAERLFSRDGAAKKLMNRLSDHANRAGYEMDHAEEIIVMPIWQKQKDDAQTELELAVKKLNSARRSPASETLRDHVREAYNRYRSSQQPSLPSAEMDEQIHRFKQSRLNELKFATKIGDRIQVAIAKAELCQCKNSGIKSCYSIETLKENTEWNKAMKENRTADEIKHETSMVGQ